MKQALTIIALLISFNSIGQVQAGRGVIYFDNYNLLPQTIDKHTTTIASDRNTGVIYIFDDSNPKGMKWIPVEQRKTLTRATDDIEATAYGVRQGKEYKVSVANPYSMIEGSVKVNEYSEQVVKESPADKKEDIFKLIAQIVLLLCFLFLMFAMFAPPCITDRLDPSINTDKDFV